MSKLYTNLFPVKSSLIKAIGYGLFQNKENKKYKTVLEIQFKNNSIYRYYNVSSVNVVGIMNSMSKGSYFSTYIKPYYNFRKLSISK